jgi:pyruvate formate lyase activating enzyme
MKIGGFVKQSLIDYPGKMAAVIFTQGCNFRCGYCHNPQLVLPHLFQDFPEYAPENILCFLNERREWLDAVVVTGGEPTIHPDLPDFLREIKKLGYPIKLDTNGSNPAMIEQILNEKLVDYIAMDIKIHHNDALFSQIVGLSDVKQLTENILASVIILKQTNTMVEFRTTSIPGIHDEVMIDIIKKFIGSGNYYKTNPFRQGSTVSANLKNTE